MFIMVEGPPDKHAGTCHRRAYTWVNAQHSQCKENKERSEGNERKKKLPVPGRGIKPTTLTLKGKAPVCIATFTLHKDSWLQLLYEYHEGYILNSIACDPQYNIQEHDYKNIP